MPTNITDSDAFTDPCTRPAGADVRNSASVQAPFQALANRTRFLANQLGGITGAGEWTYRSARTRTMLFSLWDAQFHDLDWSRATDPTTNHYMTSGGDQKPLVIPLQDALREGQSIDSIRVLCKPKTAQAPGSRMKAQLWSVLPIFGTPAAPTPGASGAAVEDDGTTNVQAIQLTYGPSIAVVKSGSDVAREWYLVITSAASGGAFDDRVYAVQATILDPGPRNV